MTNIQKFLVLPVLGILTILGGVALGYAQLGSAYGNAKGQMGEQRFTGDHVRGTITAMRGDTLTIETASDMEYTIDASNATVRRFETGNVPENIILTDLKVGDAIGVHGDIKGVIVTATDIMSGTPGFGKGMSNGRGMRSGNSVMGEVTAVDGTTITIATPDGRTFTVDADEATILKTSEGSLSDVTEGDRINVHGTVDGTSVTATRIMTDMPEPLGIQQ